METEVMDKPIVQPQPGSAIIQKVSWSWQRIAFLTTLLVAAFLNFYRLDQNGYTNEYYTAAVRSMLVSWHNFFFNSYDPAGFITLDKPPVAFWLQTISAWLFGFNGVSVLIPSALAGVASVALLYQMVGKVFGATAGLIAAIALTLTPINVVMNRHNNPESILIFFLLVAAWGLSRALEKGQLGWLLFSVAMVGVAFNVKMLVACVVLPTFYLVYFLLAPLEWWKRIIQLAVATAVLSAVALSWALIVDMTPADQRPYVGGSTNNSVMNLILEYNGVGRIDGDQMGPGVSRGGQNGNGATPQFPGGQNGAAGQFPFPGGQPGTGTGTPPQFPGRQNGDGTIPQFPGGNRQPGNGTNLQPGQGQPGNGANLQPGLPGTPPTGNNLPGQTGNPPVGNFQPGGGGGGVIAGQAGPLRMFDPQLAGEAGWLLLLALPGVLFAAGQAWRRFPPGAERRQRWQALLLWGGWLVTFMVVFSEAKGIFHSYYLVMLAPAAAALAGASIEALWYAYRQGGWRSWLLPVILIATAIFQFTILSAYSDWNRTLGLIVIGTEVVAACVLLAVPRLTQPGSFKWVAGVTTGAVLTLLAAPAAWSVYSVLFKGYTNATLPTAVPAGANFSSFNNANSRNGLLTNLQANWNSWLTGLVIGLAVVALLLVALRFVRSQIQARSHIERGMTVMAVVVVLVLSISMAFSALPPVASASNRGFQPAAGQIGNPAMTLNSNDRLIAFLEANRAGRTYLLATGSSQNASAMIIKTGEPIIALGGFSGRDAAATAESVAQMVQNNTVRYFLLDGMGFGGRGQSSVNGWVQQNCKVVDSQLWSANANGNGNSNFNAGRDGRGGPGGGGQLYDCAGGGS